MTTRKVWVGSVGPLQYDDGGAYPDALASFQGLRVLQVFIESAASQDYHVMRYAELGAASSPTFVTVKLTALTDNFIPYHVSDAVGLANSVMSKSGDSLVVNGGFKIGDTADPGDNNLEVVGKFGCNNVSAQGKYSVGADCTDLASAIVLVNKIRAALIYNGICDI